MEQRALMPCSQIERKKRRSAFFRRNLRPISLKSAVLAGIGGFSGIALLGLLWGATTIPLLIAPFGATCVLLFAAPSSPMAQPANVIGGHLVTTSIAVFLADILPNGAWYAVPFAVGLAIAAMALLRLTHPPAGANPIVASTGEIETAFLVVPVMLGAVLLVIVATVFHLATSAEYPAHKDDANSK